MAVALLVRKRRYLPGIFASIGRWERPQEPPVGAVAAPAADD